MGGLTPKAPDQLGTTGLSYATLVVQPRPIRPGLPAALCKYRPSDEESVLLVLQGSRSFAPGGYHHLDRVRRTEIQRTSGEETDHLAPSVAYVLPAEPPVLQMPSLAEGDATYDDSSVTKLF
ncbi:hypothetical protein PG993_014809 [Apiospora rasikravindrae]|uniref:Uncharacterized protein n=1 Tax=Apiospora rasikravindrae TaxID=990691 RepID=A0ABR1RNS8_9PEZI